MKDERKEKRKLEIKKNIIHKEMKERKKGEILVPILLLYLNGSVLLFCS